MIGSLVYYRKTTSAKYCLPNSYILIYACRCIFKSGDFMTIGEKG